MKHDPELAEMLNRAARNHGMTIARDQKDMATSQLYEDMEAEERAWAQLKRAFLIATGLLVCLMSAVMFA
jgi:hypothetical protein